MFEHYENRLKELLREKDSIERELEEEIQKLRIAYDSKLACLNDFCEVLRKAASIYHENAETLRRAAEIVEQNMPVLSIDKPDLTLLEQAKPQRGPQKWPIPVGDAVEKVLRLEGSPMKVSAIQAAIAQLGVTPEAKNLRSAIASDHRNRFFQATYGVWGLREWASQNESLEKEGVSQVAA